MRINWIKILIPAFNILHNVFESVQINLEMLLRSKSHPDEPHKFFLLDIVLKAIRANNTKKKFVERKFSGKQRNEEFSALVEFSEMLNAAEQKIRNLKEREVEDYIESMKKIILQQREKAVIDIAKSNDTDIQLYSKSICQAADMFIQWHTEIYTLYSKQFLKDKV